MSEQRIWIRALGEKESQLSFSSPFTHLFIVH